jgi:tetratricopeptide (TPR) repeat protein
MGAFRSSGAEALMIRCLVEAARIGLVAVMAAPAVITAHGAAPQLSPPPSPPAHISLPPEALGDLALARQQYIQAIEDYQQVPRKTAVVWNKIGIAYHHLFAYDVARHDYERALRMRPDFPQALNNMGAVYYAKKRYGKAVKYYRKSLRLDPTSAPVYSNLAVAYFAQDKVPQGVEAIRAAFDLDPNIFSLDSPQLISSALPARDRAQQDFCLARLFAQAGNFGQAINFLRRALDEGFSDRKKLLGDRTLASLRATPEFAELMNEQKLQKR